MTTKETIIVLFIFFIIPMIGIIGYFGLLLKMEKQKISKPPIVSLFMIFVNYGVLLLLVLIDIFWKYSGMVFVGAVYLIAVAPFVMGIIAFKNYKKRKLSKYHLLSFIFGLSYLVLLPLVYLVFSVID